ncbi:unnamed protein product, partial [Mesorhabditis belari]|uniref:PDZ domain-containing protein n=1 Tax=Mesorhabditis belari TaxID=2138241 RepID=A0AAF3J239_9BILA
MDFGWPKRHHSGNRQRSRSRSRNRGRFYTQPINPTQLNPVEPSVKDATPEGIAQSEALKKTVNERNPYFMVQLAQGSKTHTITDVRSTNQLYEKVVECFPEVALDDILYLTVGTYKPDMTAVVAGQLNFGDLIFVHLKGEKRVVELLKTERLMGMTISDNGAGKCFVKKLKPGSTAEKARPAIDDGMHIEKVNDTSVVGMRHYQVANLLREIPIGHTVKLRLISPLQSGFSMLGARSQAASSKPKKELENGGMTLRFKANGNAVVQQIPDPTKAQEDEGEVPAGVVAAINRLFEEYIGFSDEELSRNVCEIAATCTSPFDMVKKLKESEISVFSFPDELVFDMFGLYSDLKSGRGVRASTTPIALAK